MASGILAESTLTSMASQGYPNIKAKIQYRQKESSISGKVTLQARIYYEWGANAPQTFNNCNMKIYSSGFPGTSGSTLLKSQNYSWTRTQTAGNCTTSWYDVYTWSNRESVTLYAVVEAVTSTAERWTVTVSGIKYSYKLATSTDDGCTITVSRQSSGVGSAGSVANNGILYAGDSLKIFVAPNTNYQVKTLKVNGSSFTSGNTHIVSGNVSVAATSQVLASSVGATDANIGSVSTITVTKYEQSYCHSLEYTFGSLTGFITSNGDVSNTEVKFSGTSVPFTVPNMFYAQIPNSKYGTCTIKCKTYASSSSTDVLGTPATCTFRVTASSSESSPVVSGTVVDTNATTISLTGSSARLVRFESIAECTIAARAQNEASIRSKSINGETISGNTRTISGDNLVSGTFTFSATDSRGYTGSNTVDAGMIPYIRLTCNPVFYRPSPTSGEVSLMFSGNLYTGEWREGVSNTIEIKYRYRESSAGAFTDNWKTISSGYVIQTSRYSTPSAIALTDDNDSTTGFDYMNSYVFQIQVTDGDGTTVLQTVTKEVAVQEGIPVFDWGKNDFHLSVPLIMDAGKQLTMGSTNLTEQMVQNMQNIPNVKFTKGDLPVSTATTISLPIYEYGVIFVLSAASTKCCVILYRSRSGAAIDPLILGSHSDLTITPGVNQITITPSSGAQTAYIKLSY